MDVNNNIKLIAETISGYTVIVDSSNGANVKLDKTAMPCILIFIQDSGEYNSSNSHYRDSVNIKIAVLNKIHKGFIESDVDTIRATLKNDMVLLYHRLKNNFQFEVNTKSLKYEVVYDDFDANLIGVTFADNVKERVGVNLFCNPVPQPSGFEVIIKDQDGNILQIFTESGEYVVNLEPQEMIGRYINENFTGGTITLADTPITDSEELHIDGDLQTIGLHYTIVDNVITLSVAVTEPSVINCPYKK